MKLKKIGALLLALSLATVGMVGCGDQPEEGKDTSLDDIIAKGELSVAISPDYAPYEYLDLKTNECVGSDVEFAKYIAEELGVTLKIDQMNFESCLAAGQSGSSDLVISSLSWDAKRAKSMALSDLYNTDNAIIETVLVKKDQAENFKTVEDFDGKTIAAQNGTVQWTMVTEQTPKAKAEPISVIGDAVMMLLQGKVDAVAVPKDVAESVMKNYEELTMPEFIYHTEEEGNVVATKKGNEALMKKVNEIIAKAQSEGLFLQWLENANTAADAQGLQ